MNKINNPNTISILYDYSMGGITFNAKLFNVDMIITYYQNAEQMDRILFSCYTSILIKEFFYEAFSNR